MSARQRKSKKRSGANSRSTKLPDEHFEFFVDECVAFRHVSAMLRGLGYVAHVPGDPNTFKTGTLDPDWLPIVGERQWILITKDKSIRKRNIEVEALHGAAVRTFVLTASDVRGEEQALIVEEALPAMLRLLRRRSSHFIARVTGQSNVEIIEFHKHGKKRS